MLKETNEPPNVCTGSRGTQTRVSAKNTVLFPARGNIPKYHEFLGWKTLARKLNSLDGPGKKLLEKTRVVRNNAWFLLRIIVEGCKREGEWNRYYVPPLSLLLVREIK